MAYLIPIIIIVGAVMVIFTDRDFARSAIPLLLWILGWIVIVFLFKVVLDVEDGKYAVVSMLIWSVFIFLPQGKGFRLRILEAIHGPGEEKRTRLKQKKQERTRSAGEQDRHITLDTETSDAAYEGIFAYNAKQPTNGHEFIYVLMNPSYGKDVLKIGRTVRSPEERAKELSTLTGVPADFIVVYEARVSDSRRMERLIHERLAKYRISHKREFFKLPLKDAVSVVHKVVDEANTLS